VDRRVTQWIASVANSLSLFQVGDDVVEPVGVALDGEVRPPPSGDPGLPEVTRLVVLLGSQGEVAGGTLS